MIAQIVALAAGNGAVELRRLRGRIIAGAVALAGLLLAIGFAVAALYLWLTTRIEPWQAALLSAAVALGVAGAALLAGKGASRRPRADAADLVAEVERVMAQVTKEAEDRPKTAVATALAAGIVLGRILGR